MAAEGAVRRGWSAKTTGLWQAHVVLGKLHSTSRGDDETTKGTTGSSNTAQQAAEEHFLKAAEVARKGGLLPLELRALQGLR